MHKISDKLKRNGVRCGLILAGIVIVGIAASDGDEANAGEPRMPMHQSAMAMPYSGPSPLEMMYIPSPPGFDTALRPKTDQTPIGWYGVRPVGRTDDGTPVYAQMPVYDEVPEAFIVTIVPPGLDPRFPGMPRQELVPPKGRKRKAFIRKLEEEFKQTIDSQGAYQAWGNVSGAAAAEMAEAEKGRIEYSAKAQELCDLEHQRQMDLSDRRFYHMNDNQLQHYRDGWKPVVQPIGGQQYGTPDLMVSPYDGKVYRVP